MKPDDLPTPCNSGPLPVRRLSKPAIGHLQRRKACSRLFGSIHYLATIGDDCVEAVPFEVKIELGLFQDGMCADLLGVFIRSAWTEYYSLTRKRAKITNGPLLVY